MWGILKRALVPGRTGTRFFSTRRWNAEYGWLSAKLARWLVKCKRHHVWLVTADKTQVQIKLGKASMGGRAGCLWCWSTETAAMAHAGQAEPAAPASLDDSDDVTQHSSDQGE